MKATTQKKLDEFFIGIMVFAKENGGSWFGIADFAKLASSAINYLKKKGYIENAERRECAVYLCRLFEKGINKSLPENHLNMIVDEMVRYVDIDSALAGIIAAIEYAR